MSSRPEGVRGRGNALSVKLALMKHGKYKNKIMHLAALFCWEPAFSLRREDRLE